MIRIQHWRSKCIGCNACVEAYPERWRVSRKDGKCTLIGAKLNHGVHELATEDVEAEFHLNAAAHCPVNIIKVIRTGNHR